jgi:hypothetical protein
MFLPPGFDQAIASEAAALVIQAYDQYTAFKNHLPWNLQGNYDTLAKLSAKPEGLLKPVEPFGFVARNKETSNVFVTFRGTESLDDWLSDFTFPQVPHPWGAVEDGFAKIYIQCSASVQVGVKSAGAVPAVYVTGHSLGGGLAVLAAADLAISGIAAANVMYSFAGPRVGNIAFATQFNASIAAAWRVVNSEDLVPTLPIATPELFPDEHPHTPLGMMLMLAHDLCYEHVGVQVSFTTHKGTIPGNHAMLVYQAAVQAS